MSISNDLRDLDNGDDWIQQRASFRSNNHAAHHTNDLSLDWEQVYEGRLRQGGCYMHRDQQDKAQY